MHPDRKQRLQIVVLILVAASVAAGLIIYMLGQNANYFYTASQIANGDAPKDVFIRGGGMVVAGSVARESDSLAVEFQVTDGGANLVVRYAGILPDLFAEGEAAIAAGRLNEQGILVATEVLAKHDEKYTPPEVAESMNAAYKAKQQLKAEIL
ncbi:MAG TPA: cytochrome c maturation protein CcmE [Porticoccaceae bacterium]|jgi:cytochrome c-type biogenesis protein CcmE|nr:cytochrome c maturation protein CcmE [Porticoccaceae bacterium]